MADDAVELEYQLTKDDYIKFWVDFGMIQYTPLAYSEIFRVFAKVFLSTMLILGTIFLCFDLLREISDFFILQRIGLRFFIICATSIIIFLFLYVPNFVSHKSRYKKYLLNLFTKKADDEKNVILSPLKLKISSKEIEIGEISSLKKSKYDWKIFKNIQLYNSDLCIIGKSVFIFVPSRFFNSEVEKQNIYELVKKWFEDANLKKDLADA